MTSPAAASVCGLRSRVAGMPWPGYGRGMRLGNTEIRPVGGGPGCLAMILFSVIASVLLTILLNLGLNLF